MDIKNITGLEKPLTKLVETISEGVGIVGNHLFEFDVAKMERIGKTQVELDKQKIIAGAEGQKEALKILGRAGKRFALEQYKKQINLENIFVKTRDDLIGKDVSDEPVEKDWMFRFMNIAQDVSKEQIQEILSKILSGEIQNPGSYSLKTLDTIKNLSKNDVEGFKKFIAISSKDGFFNLDGSSKAESLQKYDLSFTDYVKLSDLGLFNQSSSLAVYFDIHHPTPVVINIGSKTFFISVSEGSKKLNMGTLVFSNSGQEIYQLLLETSQNDKFDSYVEDFTKYIEGMGFKVSEIKSNKQN